MTPQSIPQPPVHPLFGFPCTSIPSYDLLIVDGSYLIHRILYASGAKGEPPFSEMYNSNGEPTGAIYGCLKTLRSIINLDEFKANDMVVVWDGRPRMLSPRRVAMYPKYKIHDDSGKTETEIAESAVHRNLLESQRPKLCDILYLLGVPSVNIPNREGDDVIACLVRSLPSNLKLLVVSDDRDYYQLVRPNVHVYRTGIKDPVIVCEENFEKRTGVKTPGQYLVCASIAGDGSDSIDGIPGVGDTTAQRIANSIVVNEMITYSALSNAVDSLVTSDKRNAGRYKKVLENIGIVVRNLQLMDLRLESLNDVELDYLKRCLAWERSVREVDVIREFDRLEFKSYLADMSGWLQPFRRLFRHSSVQ